MKRYYLHRHLKTQFWYAMNVLQYLTGLSCRIYCQVTGTTGKYGEAWTAIYTWAVVSQIIYQSFMLGYNLIVSYGLL